MKGKVTFNLDDWATPL